MGGGPSRPNPPNPRNFIITYKEPKIIPQRIITTDLSKIDKRQQWQIIFADNFNTKKFFKLKNIDNNTYLYIEQEPTEGIADFTTIDIDNNNYKYDPAFINLNLD